MLRPSAREAAGPSTVDRLISSAGGGQPTERARRSSVTDRATVRRVAPRLVRGPVGRQPRMVAQVLGDLGRVLLGAGVVPVAGEPVSNTTHEVTCGIRR